MILTRVFRDHWGFLTYCLLAVGINTIVWSA